MHHQISLQAAIDMTAAFRANQPAGMAHSESFNRNAIERLLNTAGCERIRIYFGRKNDLIHAILVAVDQHDNDLLPSGIHVITEDDEEPVIIEDSYRCPPHCPKDSPLNT